jgi:hypothetical protein
MKFIRTVLIAVILVAAVPAYALQVQVGGDTQANDNGARGSLTVGADVSNHASATGSMESEAQAGSSSNDDTSSNAVVVTRSSIDASGGVATTISSPADVRSESDLSAYASSVVKSDDNMNSTSLSRSAVSLGYAERARLFGLIPLTINVTAEVASNGTVSLHYPWYAFLTTSDGTSLRSGIEAAVAPTIQAGGSTSLSATQQAQILAAMRNAMKSSLDASVAAEANASTSAR